MGVLPPSLRRGLPLAAVLALLVAGAAAAQGPAPGPAPEVDLPVDSFTLDNGMTFLLVRRPGAVSVAAGWAARVGSADEKPGATGLTHLLEHMLFKGTRTVGGRDLPKELLGIEEQERLAGRIRELYRRQRERYRAGEIDDPYDPAARPPELVELEQRFDREADRLRLLAYVGDFHRIYSEAGATGMNAYTLKDVTLFFITVPANKLELWFWMESDRLLHPVFRDFYIERRVVEEERRQRVESTPTGLFATQLDAMFWQSHPYGRPAYGWPSDLQVLSREDADRHFATYYAPGNLTAALVGDFDPRRVRELAERYFGRLEPRGDGPPPEVVTLEEPQVAEKRMLVRCECRPQIQALYHTVPFGHPDSYALEVLVGLLNGRTGRLYRSLVLERGIAFSAYATQTARRWAGRLEVAAEARGEARPEDLLAAWDQELAPLRSELVAPEELAKVRNRIAADTFRRLRDPSQLMLQLLLYDALGDWHHLEEGTRRTLAVTAEDVRRVARRYLVPENRTVGMFYRQAPQSAAAGGPESPGGRTSPEADRAEAAQHAKGETRGGSGSPGADRR